MRDVLTDLVREAAQSNPDGLAVVDGAHRLTYGELDDRSDRLARLLVDRGVRPGDRVGLLMPKSADAVVAIYGALKAGAAYVPIDIHAPPPRADAIARDCDLHCLLTPDGIQLRGNKARHERVFASKRDDLAYILYTSGSTGRPKGVMHTHGSAMAFVGWAVEEFGVGPTDRLSSHAPFHFDLSVFDLFAAAWAAAPVLLVPTRAALFPIEVARFIRDHAITIWYSVPSVLSAMIVRGGLAAGDFGDLRTILFAGEVFPTKYLRSLMALLPHVRFANLYGPTETNVCTWYDVPPLTDDTDEPVPIGRAIDNDEVIVVKDDGRPADAGEVGELHVRGATVMRGYWGDLERTEVHRTGDLAWEDPDGNLHFVGRRDSQIKSRGYRIELGEIETALNAHPAVDECAVVAIPDELITNSIKAYVVGAVDDRDLLSFCRQRLPRYMVPHQIERRDELPRTSTGKVDRQALA